MKNKVQIISSERIIACIALFFLSFGTGYCASTTYKLWHSNAEYCREYLSAIDISHLSRMSSRQICEALAQPITKLLHTPSFRDLAWRKYPIKNVIKLAKYLYESAYHPHGYEQIRGESIWLNAIKEINIPGNIYARKTSVNLDHKRYFIIELSQNRCDYKYSIDGPLPLYVFFKDKSLIMPAKYDNPPGGKLVLFKGKLMAFKTDGNLWNIVNTSGGAKYLKSYYLIGINDSADGIISSFIPNQTCDVQIIKDLKGDEND